MNLLPISQVDPREEAYLYDLCVAPQWREAFNQLFDAEVKRPDPGRLLDLGCGTGDLAIGMAAGLGARSSIVGIDPSAERIEIARAKSLLKKIERLTFEVGRLDATDLPDDEFDLVIGDASMQTDDDIGAVLAELHRVAKPGALLVAFLATRGSFDEFFSVFWESLYELNLHDSTPELEQLITSRLTTLDAEQLAAQEGWRRVRSVTRKEQFDYADAATFLTDPLMDRYFLPAWFALIPDPEDREKLEQTLIRIIDSDRHDLPFDLSIKATILIGRK